jgi:hypothetical protein
MVLGKNSTLYRVNSDIPFFCIRRIRNDSNIFPHKSEPDRSSCDLTLSLGDSLAWTLKRHETSGLRLIEALLHDLDLGYGMMLL